MSCKRRIPRERWRHLSSAYCDRADPLCLFVHKFFWSNFVNLFFVYMYFDKLFKKVLLFGKHDVLLSDVRSCYKYLIFILRVTLLCSFEVVYTFLKDNEMKKCNKTVFVDHEFYMYS